MGKKGVIGFLFAFFGLLILSSCSPVSMVKNNVVLKPTKLSVFRSITVNVGSKIKKKGVNKLVDELKNQIIADLNKEKLFKILDANGELKLNIEITKIKQVSGAARILLGALAGRAKVYAKCEIVDSKTNEVLRKFEVDGESSGGSIFAGTTNQAIKEISKSVINYIKGNM